MTTYFYPNRMGRVIVAAMRAEMGRERCQEVLLAAGQPALAGGTMVLNNIEKGFPFETVSALQAATEKVYGAREGQRLNYRVGQATFAVGLKDFDPVVGISDLPMRLIPLGMKFRVGLDVFARVFNQFSDQVVRISDDGQHYLWIIERCPVCWGRQAEAPCCYLAGGLLAEATFWASGGRRFAIEETRCVARGDPDCTFQIEKKPIE